ncbi:hypothetical protein [Paraburkholderia sp. J11-2]|uniref:hypothetical protein n=1 Tax=Paraburkholderia sp. J11-2 TaxID=2805431 RepID=UPI002AB5F418|nr:hypothetical protein [Paraburkholderia sp. J11-2]
MRTIFCALLVSAAASASHAQNDATGVTPAVDLEAQCNDDVTAAWMYATAHKSGRVTYDQLAHENAELLAQQEAKRDRMNQIAYLAYNDPRFELFADQSEVAPFMETCADPGGRFDPFKWDGTAPTPKRR